jgi:uncharacterized protein YbjT (DUF2867 family)
MKLKATLGGVAASAALLTVGAPAEASAPPVGPIPKGPVSAVTTTKGQLVAVALPRKANGLVWRLARFVDPRVLEQVSEGVVGRSVVVLFQARGSGTERVVFALTRGETPRAFASVTHTVRVK